MNEYLGSSGEGLDQGQFYRMLALGCFDIFVTLPINLASLILDITADGHQFTFYQGWTFIHSNWEPVLLPKSGQRISGLHLGYIGISDSTLSSRSHSSFYMASLQKLREGIGGSSTYLAGYLVVNRMTVRKKRYRKQSSKVGKVLA